MKGLILFLIPPDEVISGGIMSIFSLAVESRKLKKSHHSDVFICTYPGTKSYGRNSLFANEEIIYEFDDIITSHSDVDKILIHIPEYEVLNVFHSLSKRISTLDCGLHINILNQNIEHMPSPEVISKLYTLTAHVTQTVAHLRYASQQTADNYLIPTHKMTVYIDQSQYKQKGFHEKNKIIAYSPDRYDNKQLVIKKLAQSLPDYSFKEINNLTYSQYKSLISDAAYTITFGEGFDGYFIEPAFCGSIPLAVYNEIFFPHSDYKKYENVFLSFDDLIDKVPLFVKKLDKNNYTKLNRLLVNELEKTYSRHVYVKNIKDFYQEKYTYIPDEKKVLAMYQMLLKKEADKSRQLYNQYSVAVEQKETIQAQYNHALRELKEISSSKAWYYATTLRRFTHTAKKFVTKFL